MNTRSKLVCLAIILLAAEILLIPIGLKVRKHLEFKKWEAEFEAEMKAKYPDGICHVVTCDKPVSGRDRYCYTHTCNINTCNEKALAYGRCDFHQPTSDFQRVFNDEQRCQRPDCFSMRQQGSKYCYDHRDLGRYDP